MKTMINFFKETNGTISWRKILTAEAGILFAVAVIGYLIKNKFQELPDSYQIIIAGVFGFYFFKRMISKENAPNS